MPDERPALPLVWEGRYQPFHLGHLAVVERLLADTRTLTVVVVANERSAETDPDGRPTPVPEFSRVVDGHHQADKNPWPLWLRVAVVTETVRAAFPPGEVQVLSGHRIDLDWPLYDQLLPPERVFCVPVRDDFEDLKAKAWTELGQRVSRVELPEAMEVSGTLVRERLEAGEGLEGLLHPVALDVLRRHGFV